MSRNKLLYTIITCTCKEVADIFCAFFNVGLKTAAFSKECITINSNAISAIGQTGDGLCHDVTRCFHVGLVVLCHLDGATILCGDGRSELCATPATGAYPVCTWICTHLSSEVSLNGARSDIFRGHQLHAI